MAPGSTGIAQLSVGVRHRFRSRAERVTRLFARPPDRIEILNPVRQTAAHIQIVLCGKVWPDWTAALSKKALWRQIHGVREVVWLPADTRKLRPLSVQGRSIIIPLTEESASDCPRGYASLAPDSRTVETLRNKKLFASYVAANKLDELCPETYENPYEARYPCVLKCVNLYGGIGVAVANDPAHLRVLMTRKPWNKNDVLLQGLVLGAKEYVSHCVCKDGRILWHSSFEYEMSSRDHIRRGTQAVRMSAHHPAPRDLQAFEEFLRPLRYSGPCNFNYKYRDAGQMAVLEINPRLGGSLMKPEYLGDLRDALNCIVENAS